MYVAPQQNPKLQRAFTIAVVEGLRATTAAECDRWAEKYRIMGKPFPGPFTFDHHPWLRAMHRSKNPKNVGMKSAQMGFSETMLNITFHTLDQLKQDVLYVLPNQRPDAQDFSSTRFDTALEASEYITNMFNNVKNVGLKRAGLNSLYIRGSRSRSALKSIPAGKVILDEFEEFSEGVLPLVIERMSGQLTKQLWIVSTPMIPGAGIDAEFALSNQQHFMFHCPHCNRITELIFPECLVITADNLTDPGVKGSYFICKECKHELDYHTKIIWLKEGFWEAFNPTSDITGFYINQMYSMALVGQPAEMALSYLKSQMDMADEQEFWNSKVGIAHIVCNAAVTDAHLLSAMRDYVMSDPRYMGQEYITTMGVDVGGTIHFEITQYMIDKSVPSTDINFMAKARVIKVGTVKNFDDLTPLILAFQPRKLVIDDMPDTRMALQYIRKFPPGFASLCHYGTNATAREILDYGERITVNRTNWLDQSLGRFINGTIFIPKDTPQDYKQHVKSLVRVYVKDATGEAQSFYKKAGADHFGHSRCYSEIALKLAFGQGCQMQNMTERVI
jgi:hypothetical protein